MVDRSRPKLAPEDIKLLSRTYALILAWPDNQEGELQNAPQASEGGEELPEPNQPDEMKWANNNIPTIPG